MLGQKINLTPFPAFTGVGLLTGPVAFYALVSLYLTGPVTITALLFGLVLNCFFWN